MTKYRVPRWLAVAVPCVFVVGGTFCFIFYWPCITRPYITAPHHSLPATVAGPSQSPFDSFESAFIGHEEKSIVEHFGQPNARIKDHYGNPPLSYRRTYPEAYTTLYTCNSGTLYLSFCEQRGRWVCFRANWLPTGSAF
jgi:hypothetical protein